MRFFNAKICYLIGGQTVIFFLIYVSSIQVSTSYMISYGINKYPSHCHSVYHGHVSAASVTTKQ